jgi:hypothetical protein
LNVYELILVLVAINGECTLIPGGEDILAEDLPCVHYGVGGDVE